MKGISLGPRAQAFVMLALVATLGALIGILGDRYIASQRYDTVGDMRRPPAARGGPRAGERYGDRLAERLDLTAEQRAAVDSILTEQQVQVRALTREFQPRFRTIAAETRDRIEAVLTPEQRELMRTMRTERIRRLDAESPGFRDAIRPPRVAPRRPAPDSGPSR